MTRSIVVVFFAPRHRAACSADCFNAMKIAYGPCAIFMQCSTAKMHAVRYASHAGIAFAHFPFNLPAHF